MKKIIICLITLVSYSLMAQKENYVWVVGHDYNFDDSLYGRVEIDFNTVPPAVDYFVGDVNMNMFVCNTSISDSTGNLLFYSNGCDIANQNGGILFNGNEINPGSYHTTLCDDIGRGYAAGYPSILILPVPSNDSLFFLFHKSIKYIPPPNEDGYVDRLLFSIVKVKGNKTTVLEKNLTLMKDSLAYGEMNAVKHANGKDWWIISPRRNSNQFYMFLFTKDGIVDTLTQTLGSIPPPDKEGYGQTTFSSNGDKMIRFYPHEAIGLYHFDRSTGLFTDFDTIHIDFGNFISFDGGCAVSPSGRFLYITAVTKVYQFDLLASNISSTQTTIATWDGFVDPIAISFWLCQLGPDCKIYIIGGGDTRYYHIIHNPDEQGLACNFEQRGLVLPTPSGASIPYFPNYRLGPIDNPGVPCTATVAVNNPVSSLNLNLQVYPNPVAGLLTFAFKDEKGQKRIVLRNMYGQIVKQVAVTSLSETYTLSVEDLTSGMYLWEVNTASGIRLGSGKIIKQ
ncbi:MAG: T9SS type A sorting domain-containing protein [Saprospiraceae bacterium]|nr:T9SS type A sorting domain-containing protein [Saprospiraceae bacterium]